MKVMIFSGAGVSAESGLSTFRDKKGIWRKYDHERICNFNVWRQNYVAVHLFYNMLRRNVREAEPNKFHEAVARWSKLYDVQNVTQNVDDLFERAGVPNTLHVHGFINNMTCVECKETWEHKEDWDHGAPCPHCSRVQCVKPGIVMFNEIAPGYLDLFAALSHVSDRLSNPVPDGGVVIVAGTDEQVVEISPMIERECYGTYNIMVNPKALGFSRGHHIYDVGITKTAGDSVAILDELLEKRANA